MQYFAAAMLARDPPRASHAVINRPHIQLFLRLSIEDHLNREARYGSKPPEMHICHMLP